MLSGPFYYFATVMYFCQALRLLNQKVKILHHCQELWYSDKTSMAASNLSFPKVSCDVGYLGPTSCRWKQWECTCQNLALFVKDCLGGGCSQAPIGPKVSAPLSKEGFAPHPLRWFNIFFLGWMQTFKRVVSDFARSGYRFSVNFSNIFSMNIFFVIIYLYAVNILVKTNENVHLIMKNLKTQIRKNSKIQREGGENVPLISLNGTFAHCMCTKFRWFIYNGSSSIEALWILETNLRKIKFFIFFNM